MYVNDLLHSRAVAFQDLGQLSLLTQKTIRYSLCEHNLIHCVANRPFYRCGGHSELISREKGDHYYIQTQYNDLFSHYNFFSRKTFRKLTRKSMHKY